MKRYLKPILRRLLADYEIYTVFRFAPPPAASPDPGGIVRIDAEACRRSPHPEIRDLAGYAAADAKGFGLLDNDELVCACWYWYGSHYARNRGFWPLDADEAKLVQITTAEAARGKALARRLIAGSAQLMGGQGFKALFARVWRGHRASERAFEAAGWRRVATVLTFQTRLSGRRFRLQWPVRS